MNEKDAEIERLKEAFANTSEIAEKSFERALAEKDAEIDQLKEDLHDAGVRNGQLVLQLREKDLVIETMNEAHKLLIFALKDLAMDYLNNDGSNGRYDMDRCFNAREKLMQEIAKP